MAVGVDVEALRQAIENADSRAFRTASIAGYNLLGACMVADRLDFAADLIARDFPLDFNNPGYVASALSEPVYWRKAPFVDLLLKHGANPNGHVTEDCSPLHHAAKKDLVDIARSILRAGADPAIRDLSRRVPEELAITGEMQDLLASFPGVPHEYGTPPGDDKD